MDEGSRYYPSPSSHQANKLERSLDLTSPVRDERSSVFINLVDVDQDLSDPDQHSTPSHFTSISPLFSNPSSEDHDSTSSSEGSTDSSQDPVGSVFSVHIIAYKSEQTVNKSACTFPHVCSPCSPLDPDVDHPSDGPAITINAVNDRGSVSEDESGPGPTPMVLRDGEVRGWWLDHSRPLESTTAIAHGAVDDHRLRILIDSGASVSIISFDLARRLKLALTNVRLSSVHNYATTTKERFCDAEIKLTLGDNLVYFMTIQVGQLNPNSPFQVLLGWDFMRRAGVRLDATRNLMTLPNEEVVQLEGQPVASSSQLITLDHATSLVQPIPESISIVRFVNKVPKGYVLWVTRGRHWLPTIRYGPSKEPISITLVSLTPDTLILSPKTVIGELVPAGKPPTIPTAVEFGSPRYCDWQHYAYEYTVSRRFRKSILADERTAWAQLSPAVDRPQYSSPTSILGRQDQARSKASDPIAVNPLVPIEEDQPLSPRTTQLQDWVNHASIQGHSDYDVSCSDTNDPDHLDRMIRSGCGSDYDGKKDDARR